MQKSGALTLFEIFLTSVKILWDFAGQWECWQYTHRADRQTDRQRDSGLYTEETMQFLVIHHLFVSITVRLSTDMWTPMMSPWLLCTWRRFVMTRHTSSAAAATAAGPNATTAAARHTRFRCHAWWSREQQSYTCFEVTMIIVLDHTQRHSMTTHRPTAHRPVFFSQLLNVSHRFSHSFISFAQYSSHIWATVMPQHPNFNHNSKLATSNVSYTMKLVWLITLLQSWNSRQKINSHWQKPLNLICCHHH